MLRLLEPSELTRVSWECVHFLCWEHVESAVAQLRGSSLAVLSADAGQVESDSDLFALLAETFRFPDYFGGNWDALDECLRDMPAEGYVLLIHGSQQLWRRAPKTAGQLVESWLCAAEHRGDVRKSFGSPPVAPKPFHLVFVW
jgi:hypothetical protein